MAPPKLATIALILWSGSSLLATATAETGRRVAFFGFDLINTSLEPISAAETQRLQTLSDQFRDKVTASTQYVIVAIQPDLQTEITAAREMRPTEECDFNPFWSKALILDLREIGWLISPMFTNLTIWAQLLRLTTPAC